VSGLTLPSPPWQGPGPLLTTIAHYLALVSAYWIAAALALAFFALRRRPGMEGVVVTALVVWLVLRAVGAILRLLIPCIAVDAEAAFGLVVTLGLLYLLPLRLWQRTLCLAIVVAAAAIQASALGCQVPGEVLLAIGAVALAALLVWALSRWPFVRQQWQRLSLAIDNWGASQARTALTPPIIAVLAARLRQHLGFTLEETQPAGGAGVHASTPVILRGRSSAGQPQSYFGKVVTWGNWRSSLVFEVLAWLRYRGRGHRGPLWTSLKSLVEYEHYMLLLFTDLGVPAPRPRGLYRLARGVYVVVTDYLEGAQPLRGVGRVSAAYVAQALQALRRLRDANCAHGDIKASNLVVLPGERFAFVDLALAEYVAGPRRLAHDLADMLVVLAMHHDPEAVVAMAREAIGREGLRRALRYLHRSQLNVETQKLVPMELPGELRRLIMRETSG
jgi:tRNA A-37 threonylcarbamoyl transferase component Bud32